VNALSLESPSSVAWRLAKLQGLTLDEFTCLVLGLGWHACHSDLDFALAHHPLPSRGYDQLNAAVLGSRLIPREILRRARDVDTRAHTSRVFFCPDCLRSEQGRARWAWRARFVTCCPEHRRYLVGGCVACGETFRFRVGLNRAGAVHWLDHWNFCPACGAETAVGKIAPPWLVETAACFENGEESRVPDLQRLALKVSFCISSRPWMLQRCAMALDLPLSIDASACVGASVVFALERGLLREAGWAPGEVAFLALTGRPLSEALPEALHELVNRAVSARRISP